MQLWVEVKVLPRLEVLDVQGRAILQTLEQEIQSVTECRYGKCIRLKMNAKDEVSAKKEVKKITESILCNPLIETYEIKVLSS